MTIGRCIMSAAVLVFSTTAAMAGAGKVGAWNRTSDTKISDPNGTLLQLPPREAMSLHQQYEGIANATYCMDAQAVAASQIRIPSQSCQVGPTKASGNTLEADYKCSEEGNSGRGHIKITYDTPEHYTGESTFTSSNNSGFKLRSKIEGRWTGATCSN